MVFREFVVGASTESEADPSKSSATPLYGASPSLRRAPRLRDSGRADLLKSRSTLCIKIQSLLAHHRQHLFERRGGGAKYA